MKSNDWFERLLRSKIGAEAPVPNPELQWQRLQERRKKRRRRVAFWWFFAGATALASGLIFYFQKIKTPAPPPSAPVVFEKKSASGSPSENLENLENPDNQAFPAEKNQQNKTLDFVEPSASAAAPQHFQNQQNPSAAATEPVSKPGFSTKTTPVSSEKSGISAIPNFSPENDATNSQTVFENNFFNNEKPRTAAPQLQNWRIPLLPTLPPALVRSDSLLPFDTLKIAADFDVKVKINFRVPVKFGFKIPFRFGWEVGGGYGANWLTEHTFTTSAWRLERTLEEKRLDALSGQVLLRGDFGRRIFLKSGIGFWRWTDERRTGSVTASVEWLPNQVAQIIRFPDGTEQVTFDTLPVTTLERVDTVQFNRLDRWEAPVWAGLRILNFKKMSLELSGGMAFGFAGGAKGWVADPKGPGKTPLGWRFYKRNETLAALGNVSLRRDFGKMNLGLGVQGRWELKNLAAAKSGFWEKRASIGLALYLGRRF